MRQPPPDLEARREAGVECGLEQTDIADERRDSRNLDRPQSESERLGVCENTIADEGVRLCAGEWRRVSTA